MHLRHIFKTSKHLYFKLHVKWYYC